MSAVFTAVSPMLTTVAVRQETLNRHFWKEGINECMKHHPGACPHSQATCRVVFSPAGASAVSFACNAFSYFLHPFGKLLFILQGWFRLHLSVTLMLLSVVAPFVFLECFILTVFAPQGITESLPFVRHCSRRRGNSREQNSSLPSCCLQAGEGDKQ